MSRDFSFTIRTTRFDENYAPSSNTRITTNFANLARGEHRQQNIRTTLDTINARLNSLITWDNPDADRFSAELEIVSASLQTMNHNGRSDDASTDGGRIQEFPLMEVLDVQIVDHLTGRRLPGIVGNNFSSYVRDYDFSVVLPAATAGGGSIPCDFGELHGELFKRFLHSPAYTERFTQHPVTCISVSTKSTYTRTDNHHPVLGVEYEQNNYSLTDEYFGKMGLRVRYFKPEGTVAPLAFYFREDLLNDYTNLQLAGTIATMETFQRIYRPEIYNASQVAGEIYRPSLETGDYEQMPVTYDRVERSQLATIQGEYTQKALIEPYGDDLKQWVRLKTEAAA